MIVLYVGFDRADPTELCPGSLLCREVVKKLDVDIVVQNCHLLRKERELPDWLNGTPILARDDGSPPLRGREALQHLRAMLRKHPNVPAVTSKEEQRSVPQARSPPALGRAPQEQAQPGAHESFSPIANASAAFDEDEPEDAPLFDMEGAAAGNAPIGSGKINDDDLQQYMNARNQSPASAAPETPAN